MDRHVCFCLLALSRPRLPDSLCFETLIHPRARESRLGYQLQSKQHPPREMRALNLATLLTRALRHISLTESKLQGLASQTAEIPNHQDPVQTRQHYGRVVFRL